ncbi:MAG: DUF3048 domain-containing protein [Chloroflexi bacterium]|nr:DUF3048 domain-containing protein [Chloroflexota bacterium]
MLLLLGTAYVLLASPTPSPTILPSPTASPPASTPPPPPTPVVYADPLCGRPLPQPGLIRPLGVKITNEPAARPQSGLSQACIVYEHLTEGDVTRFFALFITDEPLEVGPVRSARLVDLDLVAEFNAIFVHWGGGPPVMAAIQEAGFPNIDGYWDSSAFQRVSRRPAPSNVYSTIPVLRQYASQRDWNKTAEIQPLPHQDAPPQGERVTLITIPYRSGFDVEYRYDESRRTYSRFIHDTPHKDANGEQQIEVANVVVQYVPHRETDFRDAYGAATIDIDLVGEGRAQVFRDGVLVPGRWVRPSLGEKTRFLDQAGRPIPFKPGNIWIQLVPISMEAKTG